MFQNLPFTICVLLVVFTSTLSAQQVDSVRVKPTAILFNINRSENKIQALKERNQLSEIPLVQAYDDTIANAIMRNFKASFRFCKVYFFNSSDLQHVIDKQWSKVRFYENNFSESVRPPDSVFFHIFIAENNYPPQSSYEITDLKKGTAVYTNVQSFANNDDESGIVTYTKDYKLLASKLCYTPAAIKKNRIKKSYPKQFTYQYTGALAYHKRLSKYFIQKQTLNN